MPTGHTIWVRFRLSPHRTYLFDTIGIYHCKIYSILKLTVKHTLKKESRIIIKQVDGPM